MCSEAASSSALSCWKSTPAAWRPSSRSSPEAAGEAALTCASSSSTCGHCGRSTRRSPTTPNATAMSSPAAEWLLDNFHIISAAARDIHHDLPPSFVRRLPRVAADEFAGLPRIYALALELIGSSAGRLDAQRLHRFISAFQSVTPLTIGELWAWPSALKLALLDHLRARGDELAAVRAHRVAADQMVAEVASGRGPSVATGADSSRVRHASASAQPPPRCARGGTAPTARTGAGSARTDNRGRDTSRRTASGSGTGGHGQPDR